MANMPHIMQISFTEREEKNCGRKPKLKEGPARDYVLEKMSLRWSPEQIAGRSKLDNEPFGISFPTIYRADF